MVHKRQSIKRTTDIKCKCFHIGPTVAVSSVNSPDCNLSIAKSRTTMMTTMMTMRAIIIPRTSRNIQSLPKWLQQGRHLSTNPGQNKGETNQGRHFSKDPGQNKGETNQGQHLSKNPGHKTRGKQIMSEYWQGGSWEISVNWSSSTGTNMIA